MSVTIHKQNASKAGLADFDGGLFEGGVVRTSVIDEVENCKCRDLPGLRHRHSTSAAMVLRMREVQSTSRMSTKSKINAMGAPPGLAPQNSCKGTF